MKVLDIREKLKSNFAKGLLDTIIGSGISKVILVLATFVFARLLTKNDFGAFSFVRNTLNMILCICALNYMGLVTKYTAELTSTKGAFHKLLILSVFSLLVCILFGVILLFIPESTMVSIMGTSEGASYFRWIGLLLPLFMLQPIAEGVLRGRMQFRLIGILQIVSALFFVAAVVGGIELGGVTGAVLGLVLYYIAYAIISVFAIIRTQKIDSKILQRVRGWQTELGVLTKMILPVFLLSFIDAPVNWWAQAIMAKYDTLGSIASMTAILQIRNLAMLIPTYYFNTFNSFVARANAENNHVEYFRRFGQSIKLLIPFVIVSTILLCVCNQPLLGLYGSEYKEDYMAYFIGMSALPLFILGNLLKINILVREHQRLMILISLMSSVSLVVVLYACLDGGVNSVQSYFFAQLAQVACILLFVSMQYIKDKKSLT